MVERMELCPRRRWMTGIATPASSSRSRRRGEAYESRRPCGCGPCLWRLGRCARASDEAQGWGLPLPSTQRVCPDTEFGCIPPETSLVLEHNVLVGIITPVDLLRTGPWRRSRSRAP